MNNADARLDVLPDRALKVEGFVRQQAYQWG